MSLPRQTDRTKAFDQAVARTLQTKYGLRIRTTTNNEPHAVAHLHSERNNAVWHANIEVSDAVMKAATSSTDQAESVADMLASDFEASCKAAERDQ
jgi:hypothetical protein